MFREGSSRWLLAVAALSCIYPRLASAEDKAALLQRLTSSEASNSIDSADLKPWHLKVTVQIFGSQGQPTEQGSIEEWWNSPTLDRREYKLKSYSATEIRSSGKLYRSSGADLPPYYLEFLRQALVHPIDAPKDLKPRVPMLRKVPSAKVPLECIALVSPGQREAEGRNYCFAAGSDSLLAATDYGHLVTRREVGGNFQGRHVGISTLVSYNEHKAASARVETLTTEEIPPTKFDITADLQEPVPHLLMPGEHSDNKNGPVRAVSRRDPEIPDSAKKGASGGGVLLRMIIGVDGSIRRIDVIGATNELLVPPTLAAAKKWRYTPATSYGKPVEVQLTTSIDFGFPDQ